jgi:hypothetical protein
MLLGFTLVVLSFLRFSVNAATVCNGHAEVCTYRLRLTPQFVEFPATTQLCDRSYGNITYVGAHDSYAVGVNNREFYKTKTKALSSDYLTL